MRKVEIFDPSMCCSTGVCGPGVDPELLRVATMISGLEKLGKDITRHNLSEEPQAYVDNEAVNTTLMNEGADVLPITLVDGEVRKKNSYPTNDELLAWTGTSRSEITSSILEEKPASSGGCCCGGKKESSGCCN